MKKIILLSTFFISVFPVALDAYEFTPKDSEILSVILRRANDAIIKKWPQMRDKYLTALRLLRDRYQSNERIVAIIERAVIAILSTEREKSVALQMTTLCENAPATKLQYNYAENIGDGRGITFGIVGFTTGTFDGNILLKYYTKLQPENNLKKYIPALDAIDAGKHDANGKNGDITGLGGFIKAIEKNTDPIFRKAQLDLMNSMYWDPAMKLVDEAGVRSPLSRAFIYDMTVNHGASGARGLIDKTNQSFWRLSGSSLDETKWLASLMNFRYAYLKDDYPEGLDRIVAFRRLLDAGNTDLKPGFDFSVYGGTYRIDGEVY